jgi:hypothetical protein
VIALIRRDFAQLSRLLQEAAQEGAERAGPGKPGDARQVESVKASADTVPGAESVELAAGETRGSLPAIDRIILYIDDLDRCPAERVVEVLEAVHLILALPLFIVVVGVDSRWLLTSLHRHYQAQLGSGDRQVPPRTEAEEKEVPLAAGLWQDEWASTPQNYLEKIFQIPFAIRPMDRTGFRELLKHVLGDQASDDNEREQTDPSSHNVLTQALPEQQPPPQQSTTSGETRPSHQPGGPGQPSEATHSTTPPPEQHAQDERAGEQREPGGRAAEPDLGEPVAMNPQGLRVTTEELEFMAGLARMVQTPRAAKRLLNTYRLIRAGLDEADLHEFVHNGGASGQYQVALILLAVLIGFPELAGTLFDELLISRAASWEDFLGEERAKFHERRGRRAPRPPTCGRWSPSSQHQTARPAVRGRASVL